VSQFQSLHVPEGAGQGIKPQGEFARLGAGPVGRSAIEIGAIAIALALSRAGKGGPHTGPHAAHIADIDPPEGLTVLLELALENIGRIRLGECSGRQQQQEYRYQDTHLIPPVAGRLDEPTVQVCNFMAIGAKKEAVMANHDGQWIPDGGGILWS
jgi:hypothetical protein